MFCIFDFRYDADIPVPYGRTVVLHAPVDNRLHELNVNKILEEKKYLAVVIITNCKKNSLAWRYVKELSKYMPLTILGGCGASTKWVQNNENVEIL